MAPVPGCPSGLISSVSDDQGRRMQPVREHTQRSQRKRAQKLAAPGQDAAAREGSAPPAAPASAAAGKETAARKEPQATPGRPPQGEASDPAEGDAAWAYE